MNIDLLRKGLARTVFLIVCMLVIGQLESLAQDNAHRALEGTWQAQTTIRNCLTGAVTENFSKFVSFNTGGTAQEISSSMLFRTAALGIWEHRGGDSFKYLLRFFRFNPDGTPAGSVRAVWNVTLYGSSDLYAADATVQILAPNGAVVATVCGSETATRLAFPDTGGIIGIIGAATPSFKNTRTASNGDKPIASAFIP